MIMCPNYHSLSESRVTLLLSLMASVFKKYNSIRTSPQHSYGPCDSSDSPSPQVLGFWDLGTGLVNLIHEEPWSGHSFTFSNFTQTFTHTSTVTQLFPTNNCTGEAHAQSLCLLT